MLSVRHAGVDDAAAIGRIHVEAWRAAYRGDMPDEYLEGLSATDRGSQWQVGLSRDRERDPVLVVERHSLVVGFAVIGPAADDARTGELYAINVAPEHWSVGAGRVLLEGARHELRLLGFTEAMLWVLPTNGRARRFYEIDGWLVDGAQRTADVMGVVVPEVRYKRILRTCA